MPERKPFSVVGVSLLAGLAVIGWLAGGGGSVLASANDQNNGPARAGSSPPSSPSQQNRVPGPWIQEWWKIAEVRKALGLDEPTVKRIDSIYRKRSAELKETIDAYNKQSRILDEMTRAAVVDDGTYRQQVKLVEFYRTDIITSRTVMLYQMYRQLQPEQRGKLFGIFDSWRERAEAARERERANASSPALSGK